MCVCVGGGGGGWGCISKQLDLCVSDYLQCRTHTVFHMTHVDKTPTCARWFHIYFRDSTSDIRPRLKTVVMIEVVLMKTHGHARSITHFMSYSGY